MDNTTTIRERNEKEIREIIDTISSSIVMDIKWFLKEDSTKVSLHLNGKISYLSQWKKYEHYLYWSDRKLTKQALLEAIRVFNEDSQNNGIHIESKFDVDVQEKLGFEIILAYTDAA